MWPGAVRLNFRPTGPREPEPKKGMKLALGIHIGLFYLFLAFLAYLESSQGWTAGHSDLGFWWAVIACLLAIAGLGAAIGSWRHHRLSRR